MRGELDAADQPRPGPAGHRRRPGGYGCDIATTLGITERSACAIVTDLAGAGYVAEHKDGRRNCYQIRAHLPLPGPASQQPTIGELFGLLTSQRETTEHS
jgi:hypothetical protein